jgi:transcriptional repressor NrdR
VVDSREVDEGQVIRRRRSCQECGKRFTTVEEATLAVIKRSGVTEPFSRQKVVNGVRRACQGRPVDDDDLAQLAQRVEEAVRATGVAEVPSDEVGLAILEPLRNLDEVAYLRFASVYQAFTSADDFEKAILDLRAEHRARSAPGSARDPAAQPAP